MFGASTPLAKALLGGVSPLLLAGLLYLGSGLGLTVFRCLCRRNRQGSGLDRRDWPWLIAAIGFGGVLGPALLMFGLLHTGAAAASLLLNLEAVSTALIAWLVFREHTDVRLVLGMAAIVAGAALLSWPTGSGVPIGDRLGTLAVTGACLCWAIDNNLTRKVSAGDALFIAASKGWVAGTVNTGLALALGTRLPAVPTLGASLLVGLLGYGVSLMLFVLALRELGSARTGAYFSTAPFIGAILALYAFDEPAGAAFWLAAGLMAIGVWLHLSERHAHQHTHEPLTHTHSHVHDEHHRHRHAGGWDGQEPHSHAHTHEPLTHSHPHYPDIHHRHPH